ncbi:hypothetical protein HK101_009112 [Irineochytrium annulatum]|nr:hypothetical protein HK101_009112 [Irineochytrium annulatum]
MAFTTPEPRAPYNKSVAYEVHQAKRNDSASSYKSVDLSIDMEDTYTEDTFTEPTPPHDEEKRAIIRESSEIGMDDLRKPRLFRGETDLSRSRHPPGAGRIFPVAEENARVVWARTTLITSLALAIVLAALQIHLIVKTNNVINSIPNLPFNPPAAQSIMLQAQISYAQQRQKQVGYVYRAGALVGIVMGLAAVWDGVVNYNIIQCWAVGFHVAGIVAFAVFQLRGFDEADFVIENFGAFGITRNTLAKDSTYSSLHVAEWAVVGVSAVWLLAMIVLPFMLQKEFGWRIFRKAGGNVDLEKLVRGYHYYQVLARYSVFAMELAIFMVVASVRLLPQAYTFPNTKPFLLAAALVAPVFLLLGFISVRRENPYLMFLTILFALVLLTFIGRLLSDVWGEIAYGSAKVVAEPIFAMGAMAGLLYMCWLFVAVWVWRKFGRGLKETFYGSKKKMRGEAQGGAKAYMEEERVDLGE